MQVPPPTQVVQARPGAEDAIAAAEKLYRDRRRRETHFPMAAELFGEPAFDLLLELFITGENARGVSITSATAAANLPATTGLRYVARLIDIGLVERTPDPFDRRRHLLRLSGAGRTRMLSYLAAR